MQLRILRGLSAPAALAIVLVLAKLAAGQGDGMEFPPAYLAQAPSVEPAPLVELPDATASEPTDADRIAELERQLAELQTSVGELHTAPAAPKEDSASMKAKWGSNGFEAESKNKNFKFHAGGRVQVDAVALQDSNLVLGGVGTEDAVDFRRARFRMDGTMYQRITWATEFDWVNGFNIDPTAGAAPVNAQSGNVAVVPALTDMWIAMGEVPLIGNIKIGNQKEPIGLEHMNSSRFLDFMERSYLQDAYFGPFNNGFTPGMSAYNWNEAETATYALGGYKYTQNPFGYDTGDNEWALTGRLTAVPWAAHDDARLVHVGLAASYRGLDQDVAPATGNVRIRSRASLRNGPGPLNPTLADTNFSGRIFADNETLLAPEVAVVLGPWLWQAEYVAGFLNGAVFTPTGGAPTPVGQAFTQGQYVQVLYFLTGEHRAYERHEARFGRVVPNENASWNPSGICSLGAWQIGARYGFLDLNDANTGLDGGQIQDFTAGLNWFLNPFSKIQFNYIHQHVQNNLRNGAGVITTANDDNLDGFGVRCAFDF